MKIDSKDKELKKILETGYYFIPRFQRPYSWEKDHINEFWNDSLVESETDYFIGSIVVYKINDERYGIVDGQQRLTTITMILCALRDFYILEGHSDLAKGIHTLIEKMDLNNKSQYVIQTETSYPYFQEHIQKYGDPETGIKVGLEEENLLFGFELIKSNIQEAIDEVKNDKQLKKDKVKSEIQKKLNELRDKVLKLKVIYIELDNEDDAYIIFETLNTRGKDLTISDLIKNHLTKLIKVTNSNVDLPKDKWSQIRETIDSSFADLDTDTFLLHEWLSRYEFTSSKKLFKKVKAEIKKGNAKVFLDDLVKDSQTYRGIFDPDTVKWNKEEMELKQSLVALTILKVTQQTPIVLSVLREYFNKKIKIKHAIEAIQAIENFHYIFTAITSQRSSGGISLMYSLAARNLHKATDLQEKLKAIKELKTKMRDRLPNYEEFLANFRNLKYTDDYTKDKRIIQYTLTRIDRHLNKSGLPIDYSAMTIEHLLAQNPKSKDNNHDDIKGLIGNLIFVNEELNNKLANKDFKEKKEILVKSSVHLDDIVSKSTTWGEKEITKRTETLADIVYSKIFKI
jgi:uncharacterized protein with ParB-like and HNH nuclease domain